MPTICMKRMQELFHYHGVKSSAKLNQYPPVVLSDVLRSQVTELMRLCTACGLDVTEVIAAFCPRIDEYGQMLDWCEDQSYQKKLMTDLEERFRQAGCNPKEESVPVPFDVMNGDLSTLDPDKTYVFKVDSTPPQKFNAVVKDDYGQVVAKMPLTGNPLTDGMNACDPQLPACEVVSPEVIGCVVIELEPGMACCSDCSIHFKQARPEMMRCHQCELKEQSRIAKEFNRQQSVLRESTTSTTSR